MSLDPGSDPPSGPTSMLVGGKRKLLMLLELQLSHWFLNSTQTQGLRERGSQAKIFFLKKL
jgi:hypothetical protein